MAKAKEQRDPSVGHEYVNQRHCRECNRGYQKAKRERTTGRKYSDWTNWNPVLTDRDKGWLEGIIDGEGCITIVKSHIGYRTSYQPKLIIGNTDRRIMDRIVSILRGPTRLHVRRAKGNWREVYTIELSNNAMAKLLPLLSLTGKGDRVKLVLEAVALLRDHNRTVGQVHQTRVAEIREEISKLNGRSKGTRIA